MNLKRKREKGRVSTGATEFESVSGYHLGPKRKLRAKELAVATALCSVFKKKNSTKYSSGAQSKNVFCVIDDLLETFLKTAENSKLQENIC